MKHIVPTKIVIAALCLLNSVAWASTTWYVNGVSGSDSNNCTSRTTPCKTIGHAISLAASGDSIMVAPATYTENLTIGNSLKVIGSGASTTIIDGGGVATVVTISTGVHVTLSKFTIQNGAASNGAGIFNKGTLTIKLSSITGNSASSRGGGIYNGRSFTKGRSQLTRARSAGITRDSKAAASPTLAR